MNRQESKIVEILAACEQALLLLERAIGALAVERNDTIEENMSYARRAIVLCLDKLAGQEFDSAEVFADVALLRTKFARRAFDAESAEFLLGEADYLELNVKWYKQAEDSLTEMEQAIREIEAAVELAEHK